MAQCPRWFRTVFLSFFFVWQLSDSVAQTSEDGYWVYFPELGLAPEQAQKILEESGIRWLSEEMGDSVFAKDGSFKKVKFRSYTEYYFNESGLPVLIKKFDHRRRLLQTSTYQFYRDSIPFRRYDVNPKGDTVSTWAIIIRKNTLDAMDYFKKNHRGKIVERMTSYGDGSYRLLKKRFSSTIWETDTYHNGQKWMCRQTSPFNTFTNKYYSLEGEVSLCTPFKETIDGRCDTTGNFKDTLRINDQTYLYLGFRHDGSKLNLEVLAQPKGGIQPNLRGLHGYSSSPNIQEIHQYNPLSGWMMNSQYNYFSNNHLDSVTEYRYSKPFGVEIHTRFNARGQLVLTEEKFYQHKSVGAVTKEEWLSLNLPVMTLNYQGKRFIQRFYASNGLLTSETDYQSIVRTVHYRTITYHPENSGN
ncbi:MAG: hypothetical protein H6608_10345 [Flavobacteriales bacterium]|nr:hypothetical protein [Bacteroidota bacterium]MCB9241524.1 hypothetical protein [Flavobacteriales bacterium]